ncbi:diguanylate cyclase domain-containing protein [Paenibacillus mucilaginosus]|uniref:Diguanylate cyclase with PAS/PAC sensor n=1 Tax=Paenibacillus mucilaginosus (strain KNP414) TaxID=1036673 RepID=F8FL80_PAEMK|nr:diguanylate cyclase [Paenibacillus mucilaginosus]AEI39999.1 diguanylate cyclase with PAS/PAC sensor [Paenibacillus mucilaginosus KNP414]MCG7216418.1 diguanylate cyclase [Paenibacillus mucilaginosus]WDM29250.1 diguanylate cyclase [Paenibacillus mucilaginosus]
MKNPVEQMLRHAPYEGEHIQVLLDLIQEFIVLKDGEGRWLVSNQTVLDAYELNGIDYRGRTDQELAELAPPQFKAAFEFNITTDEQAWQKGAPLQIEKSFAIADGSMQTWEVIKTPMFDGEGSRHRLVIVSRNVTERKKAEEELKASEKQYRLIAENMNDIISMLNPDGRVRYCSPSFRHILGYTVLEGTDIFEFMHPDDSPAVRRSFDELVAGASDAASVQFRYAHAGGHYIWFEAALTCVWSDEGTVDHVVSVARVITERKEYEVRLQGMAYYDALTGVHNRRSFMKRVKLELEESGRHGTSLGILYLDVDHFKRINDSFGHEAGDELLVQLARRIEGHLASAGFLARLGGDEFVAVLPGLTAPEQAAAMAETLCASLQQPWPLESAGEVRTSSSIGVALYPQDADAVHLLLRCADQALYAAKREGRSRVRFYDGVEAGE